MRNLGFRLTLAALLALAVATVAGLAVRAQDSDDERGSTNQFRAVLKGRQEVPLTLSAARGELELTVSDDESSVHFVLTYEGLQTKVMFAHIHVGQPNVNGGVTVFFCGGGGRPDCPQGAGTVEGDFTAADVIGLPSQQLDAHDLAKLLRAIRHRKTYANLHTMTSPGGEIRGQITPVRRENNE
jgi:hypothetical protein